MIIKSLKLKDYRNYDLLNIEFDKSTNIFYGDNAQGKTNILEAAYLSGTTKSHRGTKDRDLIRFGCEESHIETVIERSGVPFQIDMHLKKSSPKGIAINKVPIRRASELFGLMNFVFFSPEDLNIIKNGPSERRRFMDLELSQLDKIYLKDLANYNRIINQRNKLLKDAWQSNNLLDTLEVWDMQLVIYGNKIIERRKKFIAQVNEIISGIHYKLTGGKERISLYYEPGTGTLPLEQALKKNRDRDIRMKSTSSGPHRDDICFLADNIDIRKFGSQGQQRTAALSLKLSEIELVKLLIKDTPVLLLDDVLSELDKNRQNYLLDSIHNIQTLITCTGLDEFVNHRFSINKVFHVQNGHAAKEN
ncbi:DNA replication/repair protein RecF [Bariatricus massiliensis]|uniref:DNA replication and repair protein RecF n=1 Tax=Bariatricus massiliensis TaxID=1745713 RepID=A0ABS8DI97_9FIRM|nr:DNA replication/repair protein RecF [Bariatricus massiliensis]MCB7305093.1 DNA replication/repair protein RecF [Bariatricus massiliensis]MCB7375566.1 DNA replication/repair protein RecF [Bariatricus massiliensis]MCB7388155.1 DNA replication/repair protein RecF [Bariatricus massiliensis]MCB7412409.1 DNA replication/repair protein RecF [Bariatricus massiliensis]MCQ5254608.1 DNA replication/repair protein RecF [Bariatricus massiliensis]